MADEEYLTISSALESPHSLTHTQTTKLTAQSSNSSCFSSQTPPIGPHVPTTNISPLSLSSDTTTTCSLAHPSQPLTTQPPKAKRHPIQEGLLSSHYKVMSRNSRPVIPPPQPPALPLTPITAQIISSVPRCSSPPGLTAPAVLPPPAQSHVQVREEPQKKEKEYKDDDDEDDMDEEEEASRRKASCNFTMGECKCKYFL